MFFSPFESSLFVSFFDNFLENYDISFKDKAFYLLWVNNNTINIITILFCIPLFSTFIYSSSFNNSFFFKKLILNCYKLCYGWTSNYISRYKSYIYPFILYLFLFLLFSNIIGMVPFNFAVTSHLSLTFLLSFTVWYSTVSLSIFYHDWSFLSHFLIKGIPNPLVPVLLVIELLSYCIRGVSLALRLFANIFSGHILLHVISSGLFELMLSYNSGFLLSSFLISILGCLFFSVLVIFELLVGLLQAYIFTLLSLIYLSDI